VTTTTTTTTTGGAAATTAGARAHELGTTGEYLTPLALGCMLMGGRTGEAESVQLLDHYVGEVAPRFTAPDGSPALPMLDTADCYTWWDNPGTDGGQSEEVIGRWLARTGLRDRVFLATKGTGRIAAYDGLFDAHGNPDWDTARTRFVGAGRDVLTRSLHGSLRRLGVDHVDLYYVHVDDRSSPLEETLQTLAGFVEAGLVRHLGWSNVRTWRLERLRALCDRHGWPQPVALQQQHSYLRRRAGLQNVSIVDDEQLDYLRERRDLSLVAYSPIAKGNYDPGRRAAGSSSWELAPYAGPDADARFAAVDALAGELGVTGNQLVLAWLMAQDDPRVLPLTGPRTPEQYTAALPSLDVRLTPEQLRRLDDAGA
jgi:aryl-alcohol dehydrogenase-like predicted oxidoreductase